MKKVDNDYRLPNGNTPLTPEEIRDAFAHFEFFMSHCQQIVNKDRQLVPFALNEFQRRLFSTILPMVHKSTRLDRRHTLIVIKSRQVGASVGTTALINYLCAFADLQNINIAHVFPVGDTITKFYQQKVQPIISGVHPSIYPNIERETLGSSIMTHYKDIKGIPLHNYYELISSGSDSIRSSTLQCLMLDECYSGDVEVLTDKGFRRLDSLDKTEKVAQFDCNTSEISYVKPLRYIDREYNGDAFEWTCGDNPSFVTTARHNFVVGSTANQKSSAPNFGLRPAYEVVASNRYAVPVCGKGVGDETPLSALERLGIATQADGSIVGERKRMGKNATTYGWTKCAMQLKRESKINRMRRLLKEAGVNYSETVNGRGYSAFYYDLPYKNPKLLPSFLSVECGINRAREILHEVLHWDGHGLDRNTLSGKTYLPGSSYYSSVVKENRDFVAAIALQAGQRITTGVQVDNRSDTHKDVYRLYARRGGRQGYSKYSKKDITYKGRVYCVTVPTGAIVIRTGRDVWVCGNCSYYRNPEKLESAILPALPDTGFSLLMYLSTVGETASSAYFIDKVKIALDNPEDYTVVFVPWFFTYPERPLGIAYDSLMLNQYESETLVSSFIKEGLPKERWGDCIVWYRKRMNDFNGNHKRMMLEFPTTIEEILTINDDACVFQEASLKKQEENITPGKQYRLVTDNTTGKVEAQETEVSPLTIFKQPIYGHRYRIAIDPITAQGDSTDFFVFHVMDLANNEQVAVFRERGLQDEDYADWAVSLGAIYNKAELCPEINVGNGFVVAVNARHYFRWFFQDKKSQKDRIPGLRTTVSSKIRMIDALDAMLNRGSIIVHDKRTLDELNNFVKVVKTRSDGTKFVKMAARGNGHDDLVAGLWIYAGSLSLAQIEGRKRSGFAII